jgi:HD superfamily phosphodiesterase
MVNYIRKEMELQLPPQFSYHNFAHTHYVMNMAMEIGTKEGCSDDELKLIHASALWHDMGYLRGHENHEEESCRMAKAHLPDFGFNDSDIETITEIIMATKIPQTPQSKLGAILADSDLAYLGTPFAKTFSDYLYVELFHLNNELTYQKWNAIQIAFISAHHFFTGYAQQMFEPGKQDYLRQLKSTQSNLQKSL